MTFNLLLRALLFDMDPLTIDSLRSTKYKSMFNGHSIISGCEDAANCFARGRYVVGLQFIGRLRERLRYQLEACDSCICVVHNAASSGGTGSGSNFKISILDTLIFEFILSSSRCAYSRRVTMI